MVIINKVDFDDVIKEALKAAKVVLFDNWDEAEDIVANIAAGLANDAAYIAKMKASGKFTEEDARVFMEDQKMVARVRIRSLAIVTLQIAERVWNAMAEVFREAIKKALGWAIL